MSSHSGAAFVDQLLLAYSQAETPTASAAKLASWMSPTGFGEPGAEVTSEAEASVRTFSSRRKNIYAASTVRAVLAVLVYSYRRYLNRSLWKFHP